MSELRPVTLITGASAGIGVELARQFAQHGHELVLVARREAELAELARALEAETQARSHIIVADLARSGATAYVADEMRARGLEPNFVVNNAGFGIVGPAAKLDRAEQLAIIDLNARALTDLSLRFIDHLARHRGGILNVASLAGFMPGPAFAVYTATKAYVVSFSEALHHELKPNGIRVTALCPGPVQTGFNARAGAPAEYFPAVLNRSAERVARDGYNGLMAGRRVVVPGSANRIAAFLPRLVPRGLALALMSRSRKEVP